MVNSNSYSPPEPRLYEPPQHTHTHKLHTLQAHQFRVSKSTLFVYFFSANNIPKALTHTIRTVSARKTIFIITILLKNTVKETFNKTII